MGIFAFADRPSSASRSRDFHLDTGMRSHHRMESIDRGIHPARTAPQRAVLALNRQLTARCREQAIASTSSPPNQIRLRAKTVLTARRLARCAEKRPSTTFTLCRMRQLCRAASAISSIARWHDGSCRSLPPRCEDRPARPRCRRRKDIHPRHARRGTMRQAYWTIFGLAMNCQLHVPVRESRMRRCQSGNGARGFR